MKKIPYGIIDYKTLIEEEYEYVDKTMYLEKLEDVGKTLFHLRPGRFGKTLFTSMMYYYYDLESKDKFEILYKDLYVYNHPTKNKNNYYILKFDFSGMVTSGRNEKELEEEFNEKVIAGIEYFENYYGYKSNINYNGLGANGILLKFLSFILGLKLDHKIYIIIDEYDNFTNAILEGDAKDFLGVVGNAGFVKGFYAVIKEYIGLGVIDRFFATGICPVTLDSMTTGFNIAIDLSTDDTFNEMIGLTHSEVLKLLEETSDKKEEIYDLMIKNYDGYLFSKRAKERVFNATLVMYFLKEYKNKKEIPEDVVDKNIVMNYGKIDNLLKLQNNKYYEEIISSILKTECITGKLKTKFNLLEEFNQDDIISLLYYFGYLTIKEEEIITGRMVFTIPNTVMKETYNNYFLKMLKDVDVRVNEDDLLESFKEITEEGKIDKIIEKASEYLKLIGNRLLIKFDEKYIQLLIWTLLFKNKLIDVYSEYPSNNNYIDIMIFGKKEYMKYNIMIELKYIKKSEYNDQVLEEKIKEGTKQLKNYEQDERIDKSNLKKYVVVFIGNDWKISEVI